MKKITKLFAALTAAAALLAAGCKSSEDYAEDTTDLNKMNILGLSLSGFTDYNGAKATLYSVEGDSTVEVASAIVAGEYKKDATTTLNLKSGAGYTKLSKAYLYDGDAVAKKYYNDHKNDTKFDPLVASKIELYLSVGGDTYQVWKSDYSGKENAKLSIPTSAADTSDSELKGRYVTVTRGSDGIALFELATSASPNTKSNLYEINIGSSSPLKLDDWNALPGVTAEASAKSGENPKYTIIFKGLENDIGGQYVLCGADLASEKDLSDANGYWADDNGANVVDGSKKPESFTQTVDSTGKLTFTFYATAPSWNLDAPAIKIVQKGTDATHGPEGDQWNCLIPYTGTYTNNVYIPQDAYEAEQDVTITIDVSQMKEGTDFHFTSADAETKLYDRVVIKNVVLSNAPVIGGAGYIAFCSGWLPNNVWGAGTTNKATVLANNRATKEINYDFYIKTTGGLKEFDMQVLNPASDDDFWADASKVYTDKDKKAVVDSTHAGKTVNLVYDADTKTASVEVVN